MLIVVSLSRANIWGRSPRVSRAGEGALIVDFSPAEDPDSHSLEPSAGVAGRKFGQPALAPRIKNLFRSESPLPNPPPEVEGTGIKLFAKVILKSVILEKKEPAQPPDCWTGCGVSI